MKKKDKNIILIIFFVVIFLLIWTLTKYETSKKDSIELRQAALQAIEDEKRNMIEEAKEAKEKQIIPVINPSELNKKILNNSNEISILDMRNIGQFNKEHIKGSFPVSNINNVQLDRTIILVTDIGDEEAILNQYNNFSRDSTVFNLSGGIRQWIAEGYSTISLNIVQNFENASKVKFVEPRDLDFLNQTLEQQAQNFILDIRRPGNFIKGHIPNAINIPFTELEYRYKEIPIGKTIYVYGSDELASFKAGVLLYNLNFINIQTIKGGFAAWQEYGYPTISTENKPSTDELINISTNNQTTQSAEQTEPTKN